MMDYTIIISAIVGGLFGAGGIAAAMRAIGQNRVEAAAQRAHSSAISAEYMVKQAELLAIEQDKFRQSLLDEINTMRADMKTMFAENDALVNKNAELGAKVVTLESKVETLTQRLTAALIERDYLQRQLDSAKDRIAHLESEIKELQKQAG